MRSLGLDLGKVWGWSIIHAPIRGGRRFIRFGEESLPTTQASMSSHGMVYAAFGRWLRSVLDDTDEYISVVTFEAVRFTRGFSYVPGMMALVMDECERRSLLYQGISVQTLKKLATGKGNSPKPQMMRAVFDEWQGRLRAVSPFDHRRTLTDNMADAIWCAHHGFTALGE